MNKTYEQKLLADWEDIFRQGLLTFWVFVALNHEELSVAQIQKQVEQLSQGTYIAAEQTLYRVLRKQYELELVEYREIESQKGPAKKLYALSPMGKRLLTAFTRKNIHPFYQQAVAQLIRKEK